MAKEPKDIQALRDQIKLLEKIVGRNSKISPIIENLEKTVEAVKELTELKKELKEIPQLMKFLDPRQVKDKRLEDLATAAQSFKDMPSQLNNTINSLTRFLKNLDGVNSEEFEKVIENAKKLSEMKGDISWINRFSGKAVKDLESFIDNMSSMPDARLKTATDNITKVSEMMSSMIKLNTKGGEDVLETYQGVSDMLEGSMKHLWNTPKVWLVSKNINLLSKSISKFSEAITPETVEMLTQINNLNMKRLLGASIVLGGMAAVSGGVGMAKAAATGISTIARKAMNTGKEDPAEEVIRKQEENIAEKSQKSIFNRLNERVSKLTSLAKKKDDAEEKTPISSIIKGVIVKSIPRLLTTGIKRLLTALIGPKALIGLAAGIALAAGGYIVYKIIQSPIFQNIKGIYDKVTKILNFSPKKVGNEVVGKTQDALSSIPRLEAGWWKSSGNDQENTTAINNMKANEAINKGNDAIKKTMSLDPKKEREVGDVGAIRQQTISQASTSDSVQVARQKGIDNAKTNSPTVIPIPAGGGGLQKQGAAMAQQYMAPPKARNIDRSSHNRMISMLSNNRTLND